MSLEGGIILKRIVCVLALLLLCGCRQAAPLPESVPLSGLAGTVYSRGRAGTSEVQDCGNCGCSFRLKDGSLILTADGADFPVPEVEANDLSGLGLFASPERSAVVWPRETETVSVLTSGDGGKTWSRVDLDAPATWACVGFTSPSDGWLVLCAFTGMGSEAHSLYKTADGGQTWAEMETNIDEVYGRVLTGAGFFNDSIGYLGFRYDFLDFEPAVLVTLDGGRTWNKADIDLPEEAGNCHVTPLSPGWDGTQFVIPFQLTDGNGDRRLNLYFDGGLQNLPVSIRE